MSASWLAGGPEDIAGDASGERRRVVVLFEAEVVFCSFGGGV